MSIEILSMFTVCLAVALSAPSVFSVNYDFNGNDSVANIKRDILRSCITTSVRFTFEISNIFFAAVVVVVTQHISFC